jgi:hypothetical protein
MWRRSWHCFSAAEECRGEGREDEKEGIHRSLARWFIKIDENHDRWDDLFLTSEESGYDSVDE